MADEVLDLMNWDEPEDEVNRLSSLVVGAAIEAPSLLGSGFLESVNHMALFRELRMRGLFCEAEVPVLVTCKGKNVGEGKIDMVVQKRVIVELKTVEGFVPIHTAQLISYLKATHLTLVLFINFSVESLKQRIKRVIQTS